MSDQAAVELLNSGWAHTAEDVLGLKAYYYDTLIQGQSEYVLPSSIIKVHRVRLLDGPTLKAEMVPSAPETILHRDGSDEVAQGVPTDCAVALCKFDGSSVAERGLRFDRPPNWGGDEDIEVYCTRAPEFISTLTKEPDLPHSLGQAGLWRACYTATLEDRFAALYTESRNVYLRTGVGNEPRVTSKMSLGGKQHPDPRDSWA